MTSRKNAPGLTGPRGAEKNDDRKKVAPAHRNGNDPIKGAWSRMKEQLADFTWRHLVNRTDVFGLYLALHLRTRGNAKTAPSVKDRGHIVLTRDDLVRHYAGEAPEHILGLHSTSPNQTSLWIAWDFDRHKNDPPSVAEANLANSLRLVTYLRARGFAISWEDSNGRGGYHVGARFTSPAPTSAAFAFAQKALADLGLTGVETFPAQGDVKDYGNWMRLAGRHHEFLDHWSRFWDSDAGEWAEGERAIEIFLTTPANEPGLLPDVAAPKAEPAKAPTPGDAGRARRLLPDLRPSRRDDYHEWLRVGMALHAVDPSDAMLDAWREWSLESEKYKQGDCEGKWNGFRRDEGGLGMGSLVEWANEDAPVARRKRLHLETAGDLLATPDPEWLVEGYFTKDGLALVNGAWGSGKSFLGLDFALCIATGIEWHGHPVKQALSLYILGEGGSGFKRRVASWCTAHHVADSAAVPIRFLRQPVQLAGSSDAEVTALLDAIAALPSPPGFIVFDTLSRMSGGADENRQQDMSLLIRRADHIRQVTGAFVLFLHHPPYGQSRARGSSVLPGAMDVVLTLTREADALTLTTEKQKDAEPAQPLKLKLTKVDASLVVDSDAARVPMLNDNLYSYIKANPGCGFNDIHANISGVDGKRPRKDRLRTELKIMEMKRIITVERSGPGKPDRYRLVDVAPRAAEGGFNDPF